MKDVSKALKKTFGSCIGVPACAGLKKARDENIMRKSHSENDCPPLPGRPFKGHFIGCGPGDLGAGTAAVIARSHTHTDSSWVSCDKRKVNLVPSVPIQWVPSPKTTVTCR